MFSVQPAPIRKKPAALLLWWGHLFWQIRIRNRWSVAVATSVATANQKIRKTSLRCPARQKILHAPKYLADPLFQKHQHAHRTYHPRSRKAAQASIRPTHTVRWKRTHSKDTQPLTTLTNSFLTNRRKQPNSPLSSDIGVIFLLSTSSFSWYLLYIAIEIKGILQIFAICVGSSWCAQNENIIIHHTYNCVGRCARFITTGSSKHH